jgi:uroporphyrinogen decarboxylase
VTDYEPLKRDEVVSVIDGAAATSRVPSFIHFWVHPGSFGEREAQVHQIMDRFPQDIQLVCYNMPPTYRGQNESHPSYAWMPWEAPANSDSRALDENIALESWDRLDEVIEQFPDGETADLWPAGIAGPDGRYRLSQWFYCLFERHWSLRGMTNALMDYYTNPQEVHRLFAALTDFYCKIITRAATEQHCDGVWTSDDLGTQTSEFFSPEIFDTFYAPYYTRMIQTAHAHRMHLWMHACGSIIQFIPRWIGCGLDVIHPIQKYTMDEQDVASRFGAEVTIFAGMDVQQTIPWGSPDAVRKEVRFMMDTYWRPGEGRCMITAGNGINGDCTLESLEAFFDETFVYGTEVAKR